MGWLHRKALSEGSFQNNDLFFPLWDVLKVNVSAKLWITSIAVFDLNGYFQLSPLHQFIDRPAVDLSLFPQPTQFSESLAPQRVSSVSSSDSLDWKDLSAADITQRVTSKVQAGSIVLFHNAAKHTPEALPGIIEALLQDGYTFVPISQLILPGTCGTDYTIDHTGRQCPAN